MKKLFYSQNSPFARIARITLLELAIDADYEQIKVVNRSPNSPILDHSPVARVPTLVHDELVITEAKSIHHYLQSQSSSKSTDAINLDWQTLSHEGMVIGFLEGIAYWVRENRRDLEFRSQFLLEVEQQRALRCLKYFENIYVNSPQHGFEWHSFAAIALACALDLMTFNKLMPNWRAHCPHLHQWQAIQISRSSMQMTGPC